MFIFRKIMALVLLLALFLTTMPPAASASASYVGDSSSENSLDVYLTEDRYEIQPAYAFIGDVITGVVAAWLIREGIIEPFYVPSGSMEPTLLQGDRILVSKLSYLNTSPSRGDIIAFKYPRDPKKTFVKRVIAIGGETVQIRNGKVYIDGNCLEEPYIKHNTGNFGPVKVPNGYLFVLGDNRNNSEDSRYWGPLPVSNVIGKAIAIYSPLSRARRLIDQALLAPQGLTADIVNGAADYVMLRWKRDENVKTYIVQRSKEPGKAANGEIIGSSDGIYQIYGNIVVYDDYNVEPGVTYYYAVRAIYKDGSFTPSSQEVSISVPVRRGSSEQPLPGRNSTERGESPRDGLQNSGDLPEHADLEMVDSCSLYPGEVYSVSAGTLYLGEHGYPCFTEECDWLVDDPEVVQVIYTDSGLPGHPSVKGIKALKTGTAKIEVIHKQYPHARDRMFIWVETAGLKREVNLYPKRIELDVGETGTLEIGAFYVPGMRGSITFDSGSLILNCDPAIVVFDSVKENKTTGLTASFRALKPGTANITAGYHGATSEPIQVVVRSQSTQEIHLPKPIEVTLPTLPRQSAEIISPPTGLSATAGIGYVSLSWQLHTPPSGKALKGYYVYRATEPGKATNTDRINDFPLLETKFTDYAVKNGQTYYYVIRALYTDGTLSPPSNEVSATPTEMRVIITLTIGKQQAVVNGETKTLIVAPLIKDGRTMVPLRFIGEAMGATIDWDPVDYKITYLRGERAVALRMGQKRLLLNGEERFMDTEPFIIHGTTMVPLRFIGEALGFYVEWDDKTQSIRVESR
ncbi:MAG: signal peptidase I [Bacillota bacterium]